MAGAGFRAVRNKLVIMRKWLSLACNPNQWRIDISVTPNFPASFISAGNNDPLLSQSHAFVYRLKKLGVNVDTLFFKQNIAQSSLTSINLI